MSSLPLAGRRVLVTRAAHQAGKLSDSLRFLGAEPVEVPLLEIQPPESYTALDKALRNLAAYNWLILTSANTVAALAKRAKELGVSLAHASTLRVAAIGNATADAARLEGMQVTVTPEAYVAEDLVGALAGRGAGQRVLLARAAVARDVIPDALRAEGAQVDVVDAYRNVMPAGAAELLRGAFAQGIDAVTFTSSSSAARAAEAIRAAGLGWPPANVAAVSIGPVTSGTLRQLHWEPAVEASPSDIPGLIAAIVLLFDRSQG